MSEEDFKIVYYSVGQGDCILIVCPDQRVVMIDCGSSKGMNSDEKIDIAVDIRNHTDLNKSRLDALILTHPDKDHYNQVIAILNAFSYTPNSPGKRKTISLDKVVCRNVYFSEDTKLLGTKDYKPLKTYGVAAVGKNIRNKLFRTQYLHHIIINDAEQKRLTYSQKDGYKEATENEIEDNQITIMSGTTPKKRQWEISIIAGSVPGKDATNPLSLVTLLEIGSQKEYKALFLGDGTFETETFLKANHEELISNVDFAHVPHHGSDTSSGKRFVEIVNPEGAQVTNQTAESGFCLPKKTETIRWINQISKNEDLHFFDYWEITTDKKANAELKAWEKNPNYKPHIHTSGTRNNKYYLQIDQITPDFVGYYYLAHERMLFRGQTTKNLWETGVSGLTEWFLPDSFL